MFWSQTDLKDKKCCCVLSWLYAWNAFSYVRQPVHKSWVHSARQLWMNISKVNQCPKYSFAYIMYIIVLMVQAALLSQGKLSCTQVRVGAHGILWCGISLFDQNILVKNTGFVPNKLVLRFWMVISNAGKLNMKLTKVMSYFVQCTLQFFV